MIDSINGSQLFKAGSGTNCVDLNECEDGQNGGCDDMCVNTPGKMLKLRGQIRE